MINSPKNFAQEIGVWDNEPQKLGWLFAREKDTKNTVRWDRITSHSAWRH